MPLVKATFTRAGETSPLQVLLNPNEYTITRGAQYAELAVPGLQMPLLQFVRGESRTLQMELFLDSRIQRESSGGFESSLLGDARAGVGAELHRLRLLASIDSETHAPPIVTFAWGDQEETTNELVPGGEEAEYEKLPFTGVITSMTERFVLFLENGAVDRARVSLTMKSWRSASEQLAAMNLHSPDRSRNWVVQEGDDLSSIAAAHYDDARLWRVIADANRITRPRQLTVGQLLLLPAI